MAIGRFFGMIGALLRRPSDGRYLVLKRSAEKDIGAGTWECVTGRVDQGEGFVEAVHREVREELEIETQIEFMIEPTHFYRGEPIPENEIIGVMFCCAVQDSVTIQKSWEHSEHRWITAEEAQEMFRADHWLRQLIGRAEIIRALSSPELLDFHRQDLSS